MSDNEDEVTLISVKPAATTGEQRLSETIDLCNDDDCIIQDGMTAGLHRKNKRRRLQQTMLQRTATKPAVMSDFVLPVDRFGHVDNDSTDDSNETKYRQALGPVRMEFSNDDWYAPHAFVNEIKKSKNRNSQRTIVQELIEYQLNLPVHWSSSIFCRVLESRTDLLRVLITGPEGTPYANGCFFFDLYLHNYPQESPKVKFLTTGSSRIRFNPNLYECGKVCLSLLGTWQGPGWVSGKSTILQVLVSIQGLILVSDPYFNEPGHETTQNTKHGKKFSESYSANIRRYTMQYAILDVVQRTAQSISPIATGSRGYSLHPPPHIYPEFAEVMLRHFAVKATALEEQLKEWTQKDKSLDSLAKQIRQHLAVIVKYYEEQQQQARRSTTTGATAGVGGIVPFSVE